METELEQALVRERNRKEEADGEATIRLPQQTNLPTEGSDYMPRLNRDRFLEQALIVPENLAPAFRAGKLDGWYVELHFSKHNAESLPLIIVGDILIGRLDADINLDYFNAASLGVSRHHITLRPSQTQLYLIDRESTNGSLHNGLQMSSSRAYPVASMDVITLGQLNFTLYILAHIQNKQNGQSHEQIGGTTTL